VEEWGKKSGGVEYVEWFKVEFSENVDGVIVELIDDLGEEWFDDQITEDSAAVVSKILKNILYQLPYLRLNLQLFCVLKYWNVSGAYQIKFKTTKTQGNNSWKDYSKCLCDFLLLN
jgi:hypothetical protein